MYIDEDDRIKKYNKAKKDMLEAIKSINELSDIDKQNLFKETFGLEAFSAIYNQIKNF